MNLKNKITAISLGLLMATSMVGASAQDATPGVIGDAVANECVTDLGTSEVPENATGYTVNADESTVNFTVEEVLGGSDTTAVGTTNAIAGTILVDNDGNPLACSRIDVDLRTITTDESRRDGQIQTALSTSEYPVATFIFTEITGLDGALEDGVETDVTIVGNLTIHGVEKQVSFDATVTLADGQVTGTASTVITFDDFGLEKPVLGPVSSIEDEITLTIDLVAGE